MILPYRARRALRGLAYAALILVLLLVLAWLVWLLWLDRYVVYTSDGAVLDFNRSDKEISGQAAVPPEDDFTISIYYNEGDDALHISSELVQVYGYYIDANMIEREMDTVMEQLKKLPPQTPVMVEVKDIVGRFFFPTNLGPVRSSIDSAAVDQLFNYLWLSDLYPIAKFPALRDYYYGLDHVSDGIFLRSGMGLWMDDDRCYWLNPSTQGTQSYLIQIVTELKLLGFREVVLGDFSIPENNSVSYNGDRKEALSTAAKNIVAACASDRFAVSFCVTDPAFRLPEGRTRMYMQNQAASSLGELSEQVSFNDIPVRLVFITDVNDTRFDKYGVLRPLNSAQLEE